MAVAMMTSVPAFSLAETPAGTQSTSSVNVDTTSKGYQDGVEAYKLDKLTGRPIGAKTSHLYKNPPMKDSFVRDQYRAQFEAGYNTAMSQTS
jgi:hypothetical protein